MLKGTLISRMTSRKPSVVEPLAGSRRVWNEQANPSTQIKIKIPKHPALSAPAATTPSLTRSRPSLLKSAFYLTVID